MKENRVNEFISRIDSDKYTDQRITEQLLNYEAGADKTNVKKWPVNLSDEKLRKKLLNRISKIAAAVIILAIVGTTTALAAGFIKKSYTADYGFIPESELGTMPDRVITQFGEGQKNESGTYYDAEGNVISSYGPEDPNGDNVKYGDEVFAVLGLPNLIPTYLYEHYLLEAGGYKYIEQISSDGTEFKHITAGFYPLNSSKYVFIDFAPSDTSKKDTTIMIANDNLSEDSLITSIYTTEGGLICNLTEDIKNDLVTAIMLYDSDILGNASYMISFTNVQMDEIEAILDSIPITVSEE